MTGKTNGAADPAVVAVYGPSGSGKSTDCAYATACGRAIAVKGGLKPAQHVVGWVPAHAEFTKVPTLRDIVALVGGTDPARFDSILIDDLSIIAEASLHAYETGTDGHPKRSNWALWDAVEADIFSLRNASRYAGVHVVMNGHESPPHQTKSGEFVRGGLRLPVWRLIAALPTMCDMVLRAVPDTSRAGPWPYAYRTRPHDDYSGKDRHDGPDPAPMNLAELLRAAGYAIRRPEPLRWMDDLVARASGAITGGDDRTVIAQKVITRLRAEGRDVRHIRWVLRDAFARADIMAVKARALDCFLTTATFDPVFGTGPTAPPTESPTTGSTG